jgi:hypothetical protein
LQLILHRLLCFFSVHASPDRARACFGPFAEYAATHTELATLADIAKRRMDAIWALWEAVSDTQRVPGLAYYVGVALDAHVALANNHSIVSIDTLYRTQGAPEQLTVQHLWSDHSAQSAGLVEELWHHELSLACGVGTCSPETAILKKGLPKPTSIRYIATQLSKGLVSQRPIVAKLLLCGLLGAYEHATVLAPPARRRALYADPDSAIRDAIATLAPVQLYTLVAELVVAWSQSHRALAYLLRRTMFWDDHVRTICTAADGLRASGAVDKTLLAGNRNHPFETHTTKNFMFYLYKYVGIRKRLPRSVMAVLAPKELRRAYTIALHGIVALGIRPRVLCAMGMSTKGCRYLVSHLLRPKDVKIRASKLVLNVLGALLPRDRAVVYLYLHALAERVAFVCAPKVPGKKACPVFVCMQCQSLRSKARGESALKIYNSGATMAIAQNAVQCAACDSAEAMRVLNLQTHGLQTTTTKTNMGVYTVMGCQECGVAVVAGHARWQDNRLMCHECYEKNVVSAVRLCTCAGETTLIVIQGQQYAKICLRHRKCLPAATAGLARATIQTVLEQQ